jgi:two-component system, OmpR family, phosphate regulon sensor histidine kinase PhoR
VRWGFRSRLLLVTALLVVVALLVGDVYLGHALERDLTARVRSDLSARLNLVEAWLLDRPPPVGPAAWDALADSAGRAAGARITLMTPDGTVIGDSEVPLAELPAVANHANREEVQAALRSTEGWSQRRSSTVDRRMLYLARQSKLPNGRVLVRAAVPLVDVERALATLRRLMLVGSALALAVAVALSALTSQVFGRSLRAITGAATRIAAGDLSVRIRPDTRDEIGQLASTLDQLADSLNATLQALREERDRLGGILAAMEEGVLVVDPERVIAMANPAARVLLLSAAASSTDVHARREHASAPLEGRSLLEVVRSADMDAIVGKTLTERKPASGEVAVDRPRPRRLLVHTTPLADDGAGVLVVLVDVTEIRRLEGMRKDFVANVSHELRTPLTAVRTAVETARAVLERDPPEADRFLAIADRNTERLSLLVKDLLDLSRVESGRVPLEMEPVYPAEVAEEVLATFQESASRRPLKLTSDFPDDLPPAHADREALVQVLTNLVENAVKYSDAGGTLTIRGRTAGDDLLVTVEDTGPGIAAKHLPRLFERFYRVDPGRSRESGGTGLGLSIVKHLCEAMGGTVSVTSTPGKGSLFTVRLPVSHQSE